MHVKLTNADGSVVGIGMPIIAYFSKKITSAADLTAATKVTVNDQPVQGAWYFEYSSAFKDYPIEGHWRMEHYWPGHAQIHMDLPLKGKSAGAGLTYDDSLTSDFSTGPATIATVDNASHQISVVSDGVTKGTWPVALGADKTRTRRGYKVIMEKLPTVCMHDVNNSYYECGIKLDQRLTYDGEYLHAAPWNVYNITHGVNSSNGCTNLLPADAKTLYDMLEVGDVVYYPNADGKKMQIGDGYGDWNVSWSLWQTGGLVSTK